MPVNTPCKEYQKNVNLWTIVRDCIDGDERIKEKGPVYLPRLRLQTDEEYGSYKKRTVFFDATSRTAEGLHGHIFSKDPVQTGEISDQFKEYLKNVDAIGTSLDQFASNITWDAMQAPWGGILVDHPPVADGTSLAEKTGGAYLKWYTAESFINRQYETVKGISRLSKVILREDIAEENPDDEFEIITIEAYRVLSFDENGNYIQRVFKKDDKGKGGFVQDGEPIIPRMNGETLKFIPFFICPGETPEKSMLLGLAKENIGHYQKTADYENGLHYTSIPTPVAENMEQPKAKIRVKIKDDNGEEREVEKEVPQEVLLGGSAFLFFYGGQDKDVRVKFLEFSGAGLSELLKALNSCLDRMAKLGIQAIGSEKKGVETAEVAQIHRASENGVLGAFARNMSDKITQAVRLMAKWNGIDEDEADGWSYELNNSFNNEELSAQILAIMHTARLSGEIPRTVWFNALKQAGKLPENMSFEEFVEEIETDKPGGHGPDSEVV